jgi:predicted DNA-binding antitoxin AbrB/MazE fold protein
MRISEYGMARKNVENMQVVRGLDTNPVPPLARGEHWNGIPIAMTTAIEAIHENGMLRPPEPLTLPEHAHVRVSVETIEIDAERAAWLAQSQRRLRETWENSADDVFNELLTR